jgi:hypothetical protein
MTALQTTGRSTAVDGGKTQPAEWLQAQRELLAEFERFADLLAAAANPDEFDLLRTKMADLASALRDLQTADEQLLWPVLLERVHTDRALVLGFEERSARLVELADPLFDELQAFHYTPGAAGRAALVDRVRGLAQVLAVHIDDQQRSVVPLVSACLADPEIDRLSAAVRRWSERVQDNR